LLQYKPSPWTPADSLLVVKNFFEALNTTWRLDLMRELLADLPPDKRAALLPETSPLDVLVVGTDKDKKTTRAKIGTPLRGADRSTASGLYSQNRIEEKQKLSELLAALAIDATLESRSLSRLGLFAENLAASNNWVVSGKRTASGKPLLANDPHLAPSTP